MERFSFIEAVECYGEDNLLVTVPMPTHAIASIRGFIATHSNDESPQLCKFVNENDGSIFQDRPLHDRHRIIVRSLETGFSRKFYKSDLELIISRGDYKWEVKPAFIVLPTNSDLDNITLKYVKGLF